MELKTRLTDHCIQTELKRRYNEAINRYFKQKESVWELEDEIESLRIMLENVDFGSLRRQYVQLEGGTESEIKVTCSYEENMVKVVISVDDQIVFEDMIEQGDPA